MRAVVLVGGEGTRLQPLTLTVPKQMLPIVEVPMIERAVTHLAAHGVTDAVLSLGYQPDAFLVAFPGDQIAGVNLTYAIDPEPLGTAGAIRFSALAGGIGERFVVVNGDVLTDLDVTELVTAHIQRGAEATIALTRVSDPSAFGVVATDEQGRVLAFVEKPAPEEAPSDLINAGTYVYEPAVLERIPDGVAASAERQLFPGMVASGRLFAFPSPAYWIDAGTFPAYLRAQMDLLDGRRRQPPAPGARRRDDGVWTLGTPSIHGEVVAPSFVGDAAFVAAGAVVERSVVGAGARVQEGARLRSSVLLPGAVVRSNAVVEDSVVGERAVVGEEAKLTGLCVIGGGLEVEPGAHLDGCRLAGRVRG